MNVLAIILIILLILLFIGFIAWLVILGLNSSKKPTNPIIPTRILSSSTTGYEVEFVNQSGQELLLGALGPTPVETREGTWVLPPGGTLNIDIPPSWLNTAGQSHLNGPRFWARTGCRYNISDDKAQCETGDCSGPYNCSKAGLAGKIPTSLAEFCFQCGNGLTYYDVSLVDGYNLSINIEPLGGSPKNPNDPNDVFWCGTDTCIAGQDMRSICPLGFQLHNSDLDSFIPGKPNNIIGCFSNCGLYEYPTAPLGNCNDQTDEKCRNWRQYCCQGPDYGHPCNSDADCKNGGACWTGNERPPGPGNPATCQCRAYYLNPPCPPDICTNPQGAPNPAPCISPNCIGDDTMHKICPRAYTWPNDPQTYDCDAKRYRVTFSPGGTSVPITPAVPSIPKCSSLPTNAFDYAGASKNCSQIPGKYACAVPKNSANPNWACNIDQPNMGCNGVMCERDNVVPPPTNFPKCNSLSPEYNFNQGIQNCSIPNSNGSKYNCAVTGGQNWACAINPQNYNCSGIICESDTIPVSVPKCSSLLPEYNSNQEIQNCSIPNKTNKYNCAVTAGNWACGVPQNYPCSGIICSAD